jgi:hypothetical protein
VFVTLHSDFNSRAAGVLSGGRHLIGKPFMPSELAVKALTLAFEARHRECFHRALQKISGYCAFDAPRSGHGFTASLHWCAYLLP